MQIHIRRVRDGGDVGGWDVRIFSKSQRDSTVERACVHAAILAGLGLDPASSTTASAPAGTRYLANINDSISRVQQTVSFIERSSGFHGPGPKEPKANIEQEIIVEAEMVPWDAGAGCIASFYTLEQVKSSIGGPWGWLSHKVGPKTATPPRDIRDGRDIAGMGQPSATHAPSDLVCQIEADIADDGLMGASIADSGAELAARLLAHPSGPFLAPWDPAPDSPIQPHPVQTHDLTQQATQSTTVSNSTSIGPLHLAVVFFDVLWVDGVSLLTAPYRARRSLLSQLVRSVPAHAMLGHATFLDLSTGEQHVPQACRPSLSAIQARLELPTLISDLERDHSFNARKLATAAAALPAYPAHPSKAGTFRHPLTQPCALVPLEGIDALETIFARTLARRDEGLVVKSMDAAYLAGILAHGSISGRIHECRPRFAHQFVQANVASTDEVHNSVNGTAAENPSTMTTLPRSLQPYPGAWVKLKADYAGLGDSLDLVIIGASTHSKRAAELGLPPNTLVNLHLGALRRRRPSPNAVRAHVLEGFEQAHALQDGKLQIHCWFSCMWGLGAANLSQFTERVRCGTLLNIPCPRGSLSPKEHPQSRANRSDINAPSRSRCDPIEDGLDYILTFDPGYERPEVLLRSPLLVEVFGAGFQKVQASASAANLGRGVAPTRRWALRFPRIDRIHYPPADKSWEDAIELTTIQVMGADCLRACRSSETQGAGLRTGSDNRTNQNCGERPPLQALLTFEEHKRRLRALDSEALAKVAADAASFWKGRRGPPEDTLRKARAEKRTEIIGSRRLLALRALQRTRQIRFCRANGPQLLFASFRTPATDGLRKLTHECRADKPLCVSPDVTRAGPTGHALLARPIPEEVPLTDGQLPVRPLPSQSSPMRRMSIAPQSPKQPVSIRSVPPSHPLSEEHILEVRTAKRRRLMGKRKVELEPRTESICRHSPVRECLEPTSQSNETQRVCADSLRGMLLLERHTGSKWALARSWARLCRTAQSRATVMTYGRNKLPTGGGQMRSPFAMPHRQRQISYQHYSGQRPAAPSLNIQAECGTSPDNHHPRARASSPCISAPPSPRRDANLPPTPPPRQPQGAPSVSKSYPKGLSFPNLSHTVTLASPATSPQRQPSQLAASHFNASRPAPHHKQRLCHFSPRVSEILVHCFLPHLTPPSHAREAPEESNDDSVFKRDDATRAVTTFERLFAPAQSVLVLDTLFHVLGGAHGRAYPPRQQRPHRSRAVEINPKSPSGPYRKGIVFVHQARLYNEPAVAHDLFARVTPSYNLKSKPSLVGFKSCRPDAAGQMAASHLPATPSNRSPRSTQMPTARRARWVAERAQILADRSVRDQTRKELCPGAALYPGAADPSSMAGIIVLDWHWMPFVRQLMDACTAECGYFADSPRNQEGCTCCPHFDALLPHAVLPPPSFVPA